MKFFEDVVKQVSKHDQIVCGDTYIYERNLESTVFVLCDGIGSGIYANIAAINCASRLIELTRAGVSMSSICEMVADSMHRARQEQFPFCAFSMVRILNDGQFTVYTYESPRPVLIKDGVAVSVKPIFFETQYEVVGEFSGILNMGDCLLLFSDGITQAGMGRGYSYGIGEDGVAKHCNLRLDQGMEVYETSNEILKMTAGLCANRYEDDMTVAALHCREANQLTVLTGPPSQKSKDREFVEKFMNIPGIHVVSGSTTADIVARELKKEIELVNMGTYFGAPPEYKMEGMELVTEGAVMLNQVCNILGVNPDQFVQNSAVERLCSLMLNADVITFLVGNASNEAHSSLAFKQMGIRHRQTTVKLIAEKLKKMGKLVVEEYY